MNGVNEGAVLGGRLMLHNALVLLQHWHCYNDILHCSSARAE